MRIRRTSTTRTRSWNGACTSSTCDAHAKSEGRTSRWTPPAGWRAVTVEAAGRAGRRGQHVRGQRPRRGSPTRPGRIGTGTSSFEWTAQGKPHRLAIWGQAAIERPALTADITKIIDAATALFADGVPYDDYTFLLTLAPNQYGGLEHKKSCALLSTPFTFHPRKKYEELLELISHEFFHLWNVKRIHPTAALGPFDYQREAYTRSLWVMEGRDQLLRTANLASCAAGLQKPGEKYLRRSWAEEIGKIVAILGRKRQSLGRSRASTRGSSSIAPTRTRSTRRFRITSKAAS